MKTSVLDATDMFCGAGGSSDGAKAAGVPVRLAMNHWRRAIETHNSNFPNTDHACVDISSTDPRRYPSTRILIASPECTNHSQAKTRKAMADLFSPHGADEAERSRATMMDVPRFAEYHAYEVVVVENVVEVLRWAGMTPWLGYMHNLGYDHETVFLNSLVAHPTPQSRDRVYFVFWRRGNRGPDLRITPRSWCPACDVDVDGVQSWRNGQRRAGKYRQQYDYRCPTCSGIVYPYAYPAATAIDWGLPTQRIGDRAKPLADATRRRVEVGLQRYGRPLVVQAAGHTYEAPGSGYVRAWPANDPIPAQLGTLAHGVALPAWLLNTGRSQDEGRPRPIGDPGPTQTARQEWAVACAPFLAVLRTHQDARPLDAPFPTMVAGNVGHALVEPFVAELRGGYSDARGVSDPLSTICASGNHHALVQPAFYVKNYGRADAAEAMAKPVTQPFGAVTAVDHHSVVTLPFLSSYYGAGGGASVAHPAPTQTTRDRHALIEPGLEVDDCGFRMLEPHEIQAAMAFGADYVVTGNKRERVRQLGNAVTPPVMQLLLERCAATLA